MQRHTDLHALESRIYPRLVDIRVELGIGEHQKAAWDVFANALVAVARALERADIKVAEGFADRAPPLPRTLAAQNHLLSVQLTATRMLKAIVDSLYRFLTPPQRQRADRLLPTVLREIAWPSRLVR